MRIGPGPHGAQLFGLRVATRIQEVLPILSLPEQRREQLHRLCARAADAREDDTGVVADPQSAAIMSQPMKVAILAGGLGTRLAEETEIRPKPMVEIGGHPILWHIMKHYARHGFHEFVIALGYKGEEVKRFFLDYNRLKASITVELSTGSTNFHEATPDNWTVHLIDTGLQTLTGGRVKRLQPWLEGEPFTLTYGDGVTDVDLGALLRLHRTSGRLATVTAVRPPARFGGLIFDGDLVADFTEKPQIGEGWSNAGLHVLD